MGCSPQSQRMSFQPAFRWGLKFLNEAYLEPRGLDPMMPATIISHLGQGHCCYPKARSHKIAHTSKQHQLTSRSLYQNPTTAVSWQATVRAIYGFPTRPHLELHVVQLSELPRRSRNTNRQTPRITGLQKHSNRSMARICKSV